MTIQQLMASPLICKMRAGANDPTTTIPVVPSDSSLSSLDDSSDKSSPPIDSAFGSSDAEEEESEEKTTNPTKFYTHRIARNGISVPHMERSINKRPRHFSIQVLKF